MVDPSSGTGTNVRPDLMTYAARIKDVSVTVNSFLEAIKKWGHGEINFLNVRAYISKRWSSEGNEVQHFIREGVKKEDLENLVHTLCDFLKSSMESEHRARTGSNNGEMAAVLEKALGSESFADAFIGFANAVRDSDPSGLKILLPLLSESVTCFDGKFNGVELSPIEFLIVRNQTGNDCKLKKFALKLVSEWKKNSQFGTAISECRSRISSYARGGIDTTGGVLSEEKRNCETAIFMFDLCTADEIDSGTHHNFKAGIFESKDNGESFICLQNPKKFLDALTMFGPEAVRLAFERFSSFQTGDHRDPLKLIESGLLPSSVGWDSKGEPITLLKYAIQCYGEASKEVSQLRKLLEYNNSFAGIPSPDEESIAQTGMPVLLTGPLLGTGETDAVELIMTLLSGEQRNALLAKAGIKNVGESLRKTPCEFYRKMCEAVLGLADEGEIQIEDEKKTHIKNLLAILHKGNKPLTSMAMERATSATWRGGSTEVSFQGDGLPKKSGSKDFSLRTSRNRNIPQIDFLQLNQFYALKTLTVCGDESLTASDLGLLLANRPEGKNSNLKTIVIDRCNNIHKDALRELSGKYPDVTLEIGTKAFKGGNEVVT